MNWIPSIAIGDRDRSRFLSRRGGAFNPPRDNLALWHSDTGSNPAQWEDLSGNGRHAVQAAGPAQAAIVGAGLNGRQIRTFDGVDDFFDVPFGLQGIDDVTVFIVAFADSLTGYQSMVRSQDTGWFVYPWAATASLISFADNFTGTGISPCFIPGSWGIGCARRTRNSPSGLRAWLNGAAVGAAASTADGPISAAATICIGALNGGEFATANIAEILVYDRALSDAKRQQVQRYLSVKYAITLA